MSSNKHVDRKNNSASTKKQIQNWNHFPRVMTEIIEESITRMNSKKVEDKIKKKNMKAAILDIFQNGTTMQKTAEQYGLCKTTLGKYYRIAKANLNGCFGEVTDVGFVLKEHDGETLTWVQLIEILKKQTIDNGRKRKSAPTVSECADAASEEDKNTFIAKQPLPPNNGESQPASGSSSSLSNSFMVDEILSSKPVNLEVVNHRLMTDQQQNSQMLVTRRIEPITFRGTMNELRLAFAQELQRFYQGNVEQLAILMANYVRYEYELRWQENMFGVPQHLMQSAYNVLARRFQLKNLCLTDVDEGLAELDLNVGGTSHNWIGQ